MMSVHYPSSAKNKRAARMHFILAVLIASLPLFCLRPALAVPALENESVVAGEVLEKELIDASTLGIQPDQKLWRFRLRIVNVESVAGSENFLGGQEGKTIEVYSNEVNAPAGTERRITVRIRFQGDERVGRYWIIGNSETKSK